MVTGSCTLKNLFCQFEHKGSEHSVPRSNLGDYHLRVNLTVDEYDTAVVCDNI